MKQRTPHQLKRDAAMNYVYKYAKLKKSDYVQGWLERASQFDPVTEMQLYRLRDKLGPIRYRKLDFTKVRIREV